MHTQIPIESNHDLIESLIQERNGRETSTIIEDTESIGAIIDQIRSSSDGYGGTNAGNEGRQSGDGGPGRIHTPQRTVRYGDNDLAGRLHGRTPKEPQGDKDFSIVDRGVQAERELRRDSEESRRLFDATKEKFGTTNDIREAGYILPDGTMLDFSVQF